MNKKTKGTSSLLADVGGTNSRLALARDGKILPDTIRRFKNKNFVSFLKVLEAYFEEHSSDGLTRAAVACAGPVENGTGVITNLSWRLEPDQIARLTGTDKVMILNDLQAQGYALEYVAAEDKQSIVAGIPARKGATKLVVGLGTGFNIATVFSTAGGPFVAPSEAGFADLPVRSETERAMAAYVARAPYGAAIEDLLSGAGLSRCYGYFAGVQKGAPVPEPGTILQSAKANDDPYAIEAVRVFVRLLARVMSDLALIHLTHGGLYLVGGVARAITPFLQDFEFQQAFVDKGRFTDFLADFPITLVTDDFAALTGCLEALDRSAAG